MLENLELAELFAIARKEIVPISVLVEVTHKCNENCIHCCLEGHHVAGLSLEWYERLFDQMADAGTFFVILTGGEPFVRPDFLDIVHSARKRRLSVRIFTNGTVIDENIAKDLKSLHVHDVHISIYSNDPKIHDHITRLPGSFERSLRAIKLLIENDVVVRMKCPLMNVNADNMSKVKSMAQQLGIAVQFGTVITAKNNGDSSPCMLRMSDSQLSRIISDTEVPVQNGEHCKQSGVDPIPCETVYNGGAVDPFGNVYVCNQLRVPLGNIKVTSLGDIWKDSAELHRLRKISFSDLHECVTCDLLQFCERCPGLAFLEDGDICSCSSSAKIIAQARRQIGVYPARDAYVFDGRSVRKQ